LKVSCISLTKHKFRKLAKVEISDLPTPGKVTYEPTLKEKERAFIKAITAMEV
jgi:hypothetical protein